ncbi:hypothetical protein AAFF_G00197610 [Aldrovandia affinis]|uniref:Uncharacterized protein n=1 Tax=Aldrovandia affinis TaxID=143900 RepID=A0AAD7W5C0_9TELE|nr:hypothetical protein AAFF_G00197610 [Aldrovandia affinis]
MMVKWNVDPRPTCTKAIQEFHLPGIKDLTLLENRTEVVPIAQFPKEPVMSGSFPDHVYAHAAAIFQNAHVEKPAARRLVSYGKKTDQLLPEAKDAVSKRWAYELTFNALKCKWLKRLYPL